MSDLTTILLVDDEVQVRQVLGGVLRNCGYKVLVAGNYYEGVRLAKEHRLDLLIADVSLPGPNGCELAVRLIEAQPGLQVLFISGYTGADACRSYGIQDSDLHFLGKPFPPETLAVRVAELMEEAPDRRRAFAACMRSAAAGGSAAE